MKRFASLLLSLILVSALLGTISPSAFAGSSPQPMQQSEGTVGVYRGTLEVVKYDVSPPLRSITPLPVPTGPDFRDSIERDQMALPNGPQDVDQVAQTTVGTGEIPAPIVSFDGPSNRSSVSPPDPNGDVGPNHVVAMSNLSFQIYSKTGTSLYGPAYNNTLWSGFGGPCQTENQGDPIVLHDQVSDRWMLSQFTANGPTYYNCVAVSTTPDPTGTYYRWAVSTGSNFPDYPKYGWWADGLYISTREFAGSSYTGVGAYAMSRADLVAGNPAPTIISFFVSHTTLPYNTGDGLLPADVDGTRVPPAGSPEYFIGSMDQGGPYGAPQDALTVYEFHADFATPANSTFTLAATLPIAAFDSMLSTCSGRACIPQQGTAYKVDHLGYRQRPLHRAAYRNMGDYESIVTNQSVEGSTGMSGVRWWEIRSPGSSPVVHQEGTYNPGATDGIFRWMGSIAMDHVGNMALGYSASSSTMYPSVWYTGRLVTDPLGTMPQGEASIFDGTGSQTGGGNRWGDYTSMNIDPADDCTFWHVNEYLVTTASSNWRLRIGAFKFPSCTSPTAVEVSGVTSSTPATAPYLLFAGVAALALVGAAVLRLRTRRA